LALSPPADSSLFRTPRKSPSTSFYCNCLIWILAALAVGVVLGLGAGTLLALKRSATIRRLRKQRDRLLAAAEQGTGLDS
jgi:hypothetical protein